MDFIIIWLIGAIFIGFLASHYHRSGFGWFLLAILLSPLIAGIALLIAGRPYAWTRAAGGTASTPAEARYMIGPNGHAVVIPETVPCSECAEPIKPQAHKCRHCGSTVNPLVEGPGMSAIEAKSYELDITLGRRRKPAALY